MFKVNGDDIYISRGEAACLVVSTVDSEGTEYEPETGDGISLVVREPISREKKLSLYSENGTFELDGADTAMLEGRYDYEAVLEFADGRRAVIIGASPNKIPHFYVLGDGR